MIMMKQPSLVINAHDVPGPTYRMWRTVNAPPGMSAAVAVQHIVEANKLALAFTNARLENVIINCHGAPGTLYIGGKDHPNAAIRHNTLNAFSVLKPLNIGTIWLVACQVVTVSSGREFCQRFAQVSGCQVIASDESQDAGVWGTWRLITTASYGQIDEFEGTVYSFTVTRAMMIIDPHEAIYTIKD